ncbi:hypothetical protein EL18_02400 [Nitratireductor basaltis]|uniref:Uncharacterized protein n=1 Tax=Nitratireductor basaltis TaxID=472175 RepID=A0A084UEG6_9HYPH|nr:hypothetical protein EL18_02400 [Nitratireductor basaltis]
MVVREWICRAPSHPPLSCRTSPPQGGRLAGMMSRPAIRRCGGIPAFQSPPLRGRCLARQRGVFLAPHSQQPTPNHHHARETASGYCQRTGKTGGHSDASLNFVCATLRPPVRPLSHRRSVTPAPPADPGCTFFRWSLPGRRCLRGFSAAFASSVTRCYRPPTCRGPSHASGTEPEGEAAAALPDCPVRIRVPARAIAGV